MTEGTKIRVNEPTKKEIRGHLDLNIFIKILVVGFMGQILKGLVINPIYLNTTYQTERVCSIKIFLLNGEAYIKKFPLIFLNFNLFQMNT